MDKDILDYLAGENVCVIALEMPDGGPHAATVHYAHTADPLTFIFLTSKSYRKSEALMGKETVRASVVVGSNEGNMKTMQMDGIARIIHEDEAHLQDAYFTKFPNKKEKYNGPEDIFFIFTPSWWRFTDWTGPQGKHIRLSQG